MNNIIDEIRGFFSGIDVLALYVYIYLKFEFIDVNTVGLLILYLFRMIDKNICLSRLYILWHPVYSKTISQRQKIVPSSPTADNLGDEGGREVSQTHGSFEI